MVEEDGVLLPIRTAVGQHGGQEVVGPQECLRVTLELDLVVFVGQLDVFGDAFVEQWVESVA